MHRITVTLHVVGQEPVTTEVGVLNNRVTAMSAYGRMVKAGEILCWKEQPGITEAERKRIKERYMKESEDAGHS
jgi:hypothetical protein